eukprot:6094627-Prorocentrum_lima.AAC.1
MAPADVMMCDHTDSGTILQDRLNFAEGALPQLDDYQDLRSGSSETATVSHGPETTCRFKRQLSTGDVEFDRPIYPGALNFIWAYGADTDSLEDGKEP